jgi:hypothetical protein
VSGYPSYHRADRYAYRWTYHVAELLARLPADYRTDRYPDYDANYHTKYCPHHDTSYIADSGTNNRSNDRADNGTIAPAPLLR